MNGWFSVGTDSRKKLSVHVNGYGNVSSNDHAKSIGTFISLAYRPWNILQIMLQPNLTFSQSNLQYIEENSYQGDPRYIFGSINQKVIGMSLRMNLTITPDLTIQYWGQPFMASGKYTDIKMITDPMAEQYEDRYHQFTNEEIDCYEEDGYCAIDENMDDQVDYYVGYPDFNFKEFKSNLVARWEYRPGSVVYLVWSQGKSAVHEYGDFDFSRDFQNLNKVYPHNVFLIKFSYRFGL